MGEDEVKGIFALPLRSFRQYNVFLAKLKLTKMLKWYVEEASININDLISSSTKY